MIESIYSNGANRLAKADDKVFMTPINRKFLKKYFL